MLHQTHLELYEDVAVSLANTTFQMPVLDLSEGAKLMVNIALGRAWADSTLEKYRNSLSHFHAFCDKEHVPSSLRLPASEFLLCAFAASSAGVLAGSTVSGKLAAVRAWHIINNKDYKGGTRLSYVIKGVENMAPGSSSLPPRQPITADMLRLLYEHLDMTNPFDASVYAAAVVGFWCQCRLGEILSSTERSFDPRFVPCVSNLRLPCTSAGSRILHLPWTKVAGHKGEDCFVGRQHGRTDPIAALDHQMLVNAPSHGEPLFCYSIASGGRLALTRRKFMKRCNEIWGRFGLPRSTGHSFRIGGTTELLLAGVPPDVVRMMGRWSSDAFLRYWCSLDLIAPLHAELLHCPNPRKPLP